ncbi:hypothetical protein [Carboxylicivirga sp. N1Y90]|uniref:hypothetical protein n=1 Tax=Carboxylicivirga fragile TaxID=3417571 RepID=UPI003D356229|nr:hypothetical protein [Marinilabiliaceae bacterium N1Y90]
MRFDYLLIISGMLFGLVGCKSKKSEDFVLNEFSRQIETIGLKIDSIDNTGLIHIKTNEINLEISLYNLRRDFERDKDTSAITDFVKTLETYTVGIPDWQEAKDSIYVSIVSNDMEFHDFIHAEVTEEISKTYVYSGNNQFSWISNSNLEKWKISDIELENQANENADRLLSDTEITFEIIENRKLGLINAEHVTLKGALLFAPTMNDKIKDDIGFPYYAVLPVRDFCYIFSEKDFDFFSARIGSVVVDEFKKSGYPITTEILKFSDNGVEAVGKYPTE